MKEKKRAIDDVTLGDYLSEFVLDASHEDLLSALGQEEYSALAARGRSLARDALARAYIAPPPSQAISHQSRQALHAGLGALLALLKRRDGLSDRELADRAGIDEADLRRIELDSEYQPAPRTISKLERFFRLPKRSIALLCGLVEASESEFSEEAARFAAKSASIGKLSEEERRHLAQFVKLLESYTDEEPRS